MRRKASIGLTQRVDLQGLPWGIGGGAVPDPYADYLVYDTFTDIDNTDLNAHTPDRDALGGGWGEIAGDWEILGNILPGPGGDGDIAVIGVGVADHYAEAELTAGVNAPGIVARYQDATHFWVVLIHGDTDKIELYLNNAGFASKGSQVVVWDDGDTLRLSCSGNDIKVYHNDVEVIAIVDATFNGATFIGVREGLVGAQSFENFRSEAL